MEGTEVSRISRKRKKKKENKQLIENEGENKSFGYTVDLCGNDRAIGEAANTGVEADEIMTSIKVKGKEFQYQPYPLLLPRRKERLVRTFLLFLWLK